MFVFTLNSSIAAFTSIALCEVVHVWEFNYLRGNISLRSTYLPSHKFNYLGTLLPRSPMAETEERELRLSADEMFGAPGRTRPDTVCILSPLSLPLDYGGHEQVLRQFT